RELHRFVQDCADLDRRTGLRQQSHHFALRIEARAALFDVAKPLPRALDALRRIEARVCLGLARSAHYLDCRERAHHRDGGLINLAVEKIAFAHFAFIRASVTALKKASALSVAPDTLSTSALWRLTTCPGNCAIQLHG